MQATAVRESTVVVILLTPGCSVTPHQSSTAVSTQQSQVKHHAFFDDLTSIYYVQIEVIVFQLL